MRLSKWQELFRRVNLEVDPIPNEVNILLNVEDMIADGGQVCEIGSMAWRFKEEKIWNEDGQLVTKPAQSRQDVTLEQQRVVLGSRCQYNMRKKAW